MDLDASKKAQLIIFIETLLEKRIVTFPAGYVAHIRMPGSKTQYVTYVWVAGNWRHMGGVV